MTYISLAPNPLYTRPELLLHPQIPRPMHGVSPRNIMGQDWWDEQRRAVYAGNNHCCWACGDDGPLEAHECYDVDYERARMTFKEVVALCSDCHTFIHLGRAGSLVGSGKMTEREFKRIVRTKYLWLKKHNLLPGWQFYLTLSSLSKSYIISKPQWLKRILAEGLTIPRPVYPQQPWETWRMVFNGVEYTPTYHTDEEIRQAYKEA